MTFAKKVIDFNREIADGVKVPQSIEVLNPLTNAAVQDITGSFYHKFYNDAYKRIIIFGINPGRFGAGVTGVPFTDPVNLEKYCGIKSKFDQKPELSSTFVYEFIQAYGSVKSFYSKFFITAVCPLGFMSNGKNINYYDDKKLMQAVEKFILTSLKRQMQLGTTKKACICLGEGKNYKYLTKLNAKHGFFENIYPLAHTRYILQYKRRHKQEYLEEYLRVLQRCEKYL